MKNRILIIIWTAAIFLILGSGFINYYISHVEKPKYHKMFLSIEDYLDERFMEKIMLYDDKKDLYEEYYLAELDYSKMFYERSEISKEVTYGKQSSASINNFPKYHHYRDHINLERNKVFCRPNFSSIGKWHEEIDTLVKNYKNLQDADLANIPKTIKVDNKEWHLLTDAVEFHRSDATYECNATYGTVKRVEEEGAFIKDYDCHVIYKGLVLKKKGEIGLIYIKSFSAVKQSTNYIFLIISSIILFVLLLITVRSNSIKRGKS